MAGSATSPPSSSAPASARPSTTRWSSSACCRTSPRTTSSSGSSACPATTWSAATPSAGSRSTGSPLDEPYIRPGDVPSSMTFDITVPAGQHLGHGRPPLRQRGLALPRPVGQRQRRSVPIARRHRAGRRRRVAVLPLRLALRLPATSPWSRPGRRPPRRLAGRRAARRPASAAGCEAPEPARRAGAPAGRAPGARGDGRGRSRRARRSGHRRGRRHRRDLPHRRPRASATPSCSSRTPARRWSRRSSAGPGATRSGTPAPPRSTRSASSPPCGSPGPARWPRCGVRPDLVILDGNHDWLTAPEDVGLLAFAHEEAVPPRRSRRWSRPTCRCSSVAAASVLAKVTRDRIMVGLGAEDGEHAGYGWVGQQGVRRARAPRGAARPRAVDVAPAVVAAARAMDDDGRADGAAPTDPGHRRRPGRRRTTRSRPP